jgi:ElaB/YqjD/DUF883 family membrane-anchored ribosome-binding protein
LENLIKAYKGIQDKEKEKQVGRLIDYTESILIGENPFAKEEEEKAKDILKGLVEEVRALRKEVAPTKETYAERLKKGLPTLSPLPLLLLFLPLLLLLEVRKSSYKKGN